MSGNVRRSTSMRSTDEEKGLPRRREKTGLLALRRKGAYLVSLIWQVSTLKTIQTK